MKIRQRLHILFVVLGVLGVFSLSGVSSAATAPPATVGGAGNGYKVSPVRTDLKIAPGSSQTVTVYIQNVSSAAEKLQVIIDDFQAGANENGTPALLLNGQNAPQHGLKQYITVPNSTFTLQPSQQVAVPVKIAIPANAAGGGYFGAVRFAPLYGGGVKNVNLSASVASLMLVTVPGNINDHLSISSFDVRSNNSAHSVFTNGKGLNATVRFSNSGNVQEQPFGKIQVQKGKKVIGTYEINNTDPAGNVLPASIRKFSVPLNNVGSFGKYTVEGNFGYGSNGQLLSATTTFYIVPALAIIIFIAIVALILFLIFGLPKLLRSYNRRILRRAGRR